MESKIIVDSQNIFGRDCNARARAMIIIIRVRHDRVQSVIAAGHLQDDKDRAVRASGELRCFLSRLGLQRSKCIREKSRNGPR